MKKVFLFALGIFSSASLCFSQVHSKVDERFELTSIMFALAGVPEYCQCAVPSYWEDIITDLTPYELTEPINYIRKLNQHYGIGYNAVSTSAALLEITDGKIQLQPQYDIAKISEYSPRWNEELFTEYIDQINAFYRLSNFHEFFERHSDLYDIAQQRMDSVVEQLEEEWFRNFFGKTADSDLNIYVSLTNGQNNYAVPGGILIGIVGDAEGLPNPAVENTKFVLVHELMHHYSNPLFSLWWPHMESAAGKIYPYVKDQLLEVAYGDEYTAFGEWLNNLFVLMYMKETNDNTFKWQIAQHIKSGFIWMRRSIDFAENFYLHRDLYPHIEDFMLQLAAFLNSTAENFDFVLKEYDNMRPHITNVYPALGSDISDVREIVVTFSHEMLSASGFAPIEDENIEVLCFVSEVCWSDDLRQVTFKMQPERLKKNKVYGMKLRPRSFQSSDYFYLDDNSCDLVFNTFRK